MINPNNNEALSPDDNAHSSKEVPKVAASESAVNETKSFSQKRHEQWNTSPEIIGDAVSKAVGSSVADKRRLVRGETNEVYQVTTEAGHELIVRIFHGERSRFGKERWALEQCARVGVQVPRVFSVENIVSEGKPLQICVESKLEGVSLDQLADITTPEKRTELAVILREVGKLLGQIHSIRVNGFGIFDEKGKGRFASVPELIDRDLYISKSRILKPFTNKPDEAAVISRALDILKHEGGNYSQTESRLVHNDFAPQHILVKDGKVTGLIDFESAFGGDPMLEFALWKFKHDEKYPMKYLQEGYGNQELFSGDFDRHLNFWKIYRSLASLRYCIELEKQSGIDRAFKSIEESVQHFL